MPAYFWVFKEDEENNTDETFAFCRYIEDAKVIQQRIEGSKIKLISQKNTWEWRPI